MSSYQRCAAQHFGPWMIEPKWFAQAVSAVQAGTFMPAAQGDVAGEDRDRLAASMEGDPSVVWDWNGDEPKVRYTIEGAVARIPFMGQVTKGNSSFGGASSVWTRQSIRKAISDDRIKGILLHVDSPGGTVSGTGDLAGDIAAADGIKPVYAYIEDLGASAAYWIASQARAIFANPTAEVGSIGTMTYLEDSSGAYEKAGIKVHLVATGKYKGAWVDGLKIDEDYLKVVRTEVEDLNEHFLSGVMAGRGMTRDQVNGVADGRVWIADKAKTLGLIDEVASLDAAMTAISQEIQMDQQKHQEAEAKAKAEGKAEGIAEGRAAFKAELEANVAAAAGDHKLAVESTLAGLSPDAVKISVAARAEVQAKLAERDAEIERLKAVAGTQGAIGTSAAAVAANAPKAPEASDGDQTPESQAKAEWTANADGLQASFDGNEKRFMAFRVAELNGQIKHRGSR